MGSTRRRTAKTRIGLLVAGIAPALLAPALLAPALARDVGPNGPVAAAPVLEVGPNEQAIARRIDLSIGRSLVVDLPRDAKEVFVANPKVANAVVRSTRKLFLIGIENGATSIFVMDADGRQIAALEVSVGRDLNVLRQTLRSALPNAVLEIKPAGDSILMTGVVSSSSEAQQATDIANAFVGVSGGLFSAAKGAVINSVTIRGKDQVMLRVTVVEVARSVLKQFGINTSGSWSGFDFLTNAVYPLSNQVLAVNNRVSGTVQRGGKFANATLEAFERAGVSRVLAEPTLIGDLRRGRDLHGRRRNPDPEIAELRHAPGGWPKDLHHRPRVQALRRHPELHAGRPLREPHQHAGLHRGDGARLREPVQVRHGQRAGHEGPQIGDDASSCLPARR